MKISISAGELLERGLWQSACELLGFNEWVINEGLLSSEDDVLLTPDQAIRLGLIDENFEEIKEEES